MRDNKITEGEGLSSSLPPPSTYDSVAIISYCKYIVDLLKLQHVLTLSVKKTQHNYIYKTQIYPDENHLKQSV